MPFDPQNYQYDGFVVEEVEPGFVHVQFNNPKTLNAFATQTWRDYRDILVALDSDPDTKVILISSAYARAFTSGLNLKEATGLMAVDGSDREKYDKLYKHIIEFQEAIAVPARITTPTLCLLNGISYGLALDIAATTSIRVATEDAKLSIREIKIGIVADMGSLQRLPALVGNKSKLYQYALTGEIFSGKDALEIGLVSRTVPDFDAGIAYCKELGCDINQNVPWTIRGTKECLQQMVDGGDVASGLRHIAVENAINIPGVSRSKL